MKNSVSFGFVIALAMFLPNFTLNAQNSGKFDLGADFVSRYVWRGSDYGNSPSIQPYANYSIGGLKAGLWGAYATNADFQEIDLILSYTFKETFSVVLTDYFLPNGTNFRNNFFCYSEDSTGHLLEVALTFEGTAKLPFYASVNYNFYGADPEKSWYFELGYSGNFEEIEYDLFVGATPGAGVYMPDGSDGFHVVNVGATLTKNIRISDGFSLPVSGSLILNPQSEGLFFVLGLKI